MSRAPWRLVRRAWSRLPMWPAPGDRHHFVRDYRRLVRRLLADHPRDEAMSLAVGGEYAATGLRLVEILTRTGLADGMAILDLGCGSGRLAHALPRDMCLDYLGLDVVPELLSYARERSPPAFRFQLNRGFTLPVPDASLDRVVAFSLFTHLRHEESFLYLREAARALKPGGAVVFSYLEFAKGGSWPVVMSMVDAAADIRGPINVFLEEPVIRLWAERLRFAPPLHHASDLGQQVATLRKPAAMTTGS